REAHAASLDDVIRRFEAELAETEAALAAVQAEAGDENCSEALKVELDAARAAAGPAREAAAQARMALDVEMREKTQRARRLESLIRDRDDWVRRARAATARLDELLAARAKVQAEIDASSEAPAKLEERRERLLGEFAAAEARRAQSSDALQAAKAERAEADKDLRAAETAASDARERRASLTARLEAAQERLAEVETQLREISGLDPEALAQKLSEDAVAIPTDAGGVETHLFNLERQREAIGPVNLRAEEEAAELSARIETMHAERSDLTGAIARLRQGIDE